MRWRWLVERAVERGSGYGLVRRHLHAETGALGADVFQLDDGIGGQRLLNGEAPGLRVGQLVVLVNGEGVGDGRGLSGKSVFER